MPISAKTFLDKGYVPIACNSSAGIAWQGEHLDDFWMWNRQYMEDSSGTRTMQTVKVSTVKEAALRCWKDRWVAVRPLDEILMRRMEAALRGHRGLKSEGIIFPEGPFLEQESITAQEVGKERPDKGGAQASGIRRKMAPKKKISKD